MDIPGRERLNAYRERLLRALLDPASDDDPAEAMGATVQLPARVDASHAHGEDLAERKILGHTRAAAALGMLPLVDLIAVTTLQARMLRMLAEVHGVEWDADLARDFIARLGPGIAGGIVGHTVGRSVFKIIPFVGQTAGAAWSARSSAISTYAIGKAADYYLRLHARGHAVSAVALKQVHARAAGSATASIKRLIDPDAA